MEHRAFLKSLSAEQRQQLTQRGNRHAILRLTVLCICIGICISAIVLRVPYFMFWVVVQGLLLVSLFHLMHECVHDTVFKQRWPNRLLAHVCGFILFLPAIWFRYFHHAHHRYTHQADRDPELTSSKPKTLLQWLLHVSAVPHWWAAFSLLFHATYRPVRAPYLKEQHRSGAQLEMLLMLGGYLVLFLLSLVFGNTVLLYIWIFPLLLGQPFLRLYLLAEHTGCASDSNMLVNTRTVLTNPLVLWLTWNMSYHTEHHVYPTVPFHQLPRLHVLLKSYLREVDPSYTAFNVRYLKQVVTGGFQH